MKLSEELKQIMNDSDALAEKLYISIEKEAREAAAKGWNSINYTGPMTSLLRSKLSIEGLSVDFIGNDIYEISWR